MRLLVVRSLLLTFVSLSVLSVSGCGGTESGTVQIPSDTPPAELPSAPAKSKGAPAPKAP